MKKPKRTEVHSGASGSRSDTDCTLEGTKVVWLGTWKMTNVMRDDFMEKIRADRYCRGLLVDIIGSAVAR